MNRRTAILSIVLAALVAAVLPAQTSIDTSIDWSTGIFTLTASMPLEKGLSPDDHPRALEALERDLKNLLVAEFGKIAWDNRGSLKDLMDRNPSARTPVEALARSLEREWSRLSEDYSRIEAAYFIDLSAAIPEAFPVGTPQLPPRQPIGWRAVPEDGWTGIVIYVPDGIPVRGTGLTADASPAMRARILSDDLEVLLDPAAGSGGILSYLALDDREEADDRVGRRPLRIMARGLYGDSPCDIILSRDDAADIAASESGRRALAEGRVIILLEEIPE